MDKQPADLAGLRTAAFESRRSVEMAKLIERHGGQAFVSPSMREVPLENNPAAVDFAHRLITGEITIVVFLTGVGFRYLLSTVERHVDRQRFLNALADIVTVARGPKPVAAMREAGLAVTHQVPSPNTWRELLTTIDAHVSVASQVVGLQEYGKTNPSLIAGLEARGADVLSVPVYKWDLPEDLDPLRENVQALASGERDVAVFTSAFQVTAMLQVAQELGIEESLRQQMQQVVTGSVGPTTSVALREADLLVDFESEQPKMGSLVATAAKRAVELKGQKERLSVALSGPPPGSEDVDAPWYDSPFMRACRGEPNDVTPVWLMRQAGRYMAEYRAVRAKTTFLELCKNPQLCSEVMVTAVNKLGVDAAIIFSDLLPILEPMGLDLEYAQGEGPIIHNPIRAGTDVDRVIELEGLEALSFVMETVSLTRKELPPHIPLIGFAGAPFTLASYTIEGGASRNYLNTKTLMYRDPAAWQALMERFARAVSRYLNAQILAGAQCVQLFDSWAGCLSVGDYQQFVFPYVRQIVSDLPVGVPIINFATGNPALLPQLAAAGDVVVGVDWRIPLDSARDLVGSRPVQGNLDPTVLLADRHTIRKRAQLVLNQAGDAPGHIFNLGHGVLQQTPVENAVALVDAVHELSAAK